MKIVKYLGRDIEAEEQEVVHGNEPWNEYRENYTSGCAPHRLLYLLQPFGGGKFFERGVAVDLLPGSGV